MSQMLWVLCVLLVTCCSAEQLQWYPALITSDCPQCKQFLREGANFSSILLVNNKLVIGGKNAIYYLDFSQETANYFPDKTVPPSEFETCTRDFGESKDNCQNYYKVILKLRNQDLFICGTEAFKPRCSVRSLDDLSYSTYDQHIPGICPASPSAPTSYIKLSDMENVGFAATSLGTSGHEHAIQRIDLKYGSFGVSCRTKSDSFWLNAPEFIYTFEDTDYVYIIFKEIAVSEFPERVYSRVARICKTDEGSQSVFFKENFLTFVKARLYCPYSRDGASPHTFDSISGAYYLNKTLYVLFSGSNNIVETGSVLCRFDIADIEKAFTSNYKTFSTGSWHNTENPKPFTCTDTRSVADISKEGLLMSQSIKADMVLLYSALELKTVVAAKIKMNGKNFTTVHAGSTIGAVLRVGVSTNEYGEIKVTKMSSSNTGPGVITGLSADSEGAVYAMSPDYLTYIPLDKDCSGYKTCQTCQDAYPNCGWCYDKNHRVGICDKTTSCLSSTKTFYGPFDQCPALPEFSLKPEDMDIELDQEARLHCTAKSDSGNIKKRWLKNQGALPFGSVVDEKDGSLYISSAKVLDSGCYECLLQGISGTVSTQACIFVRIPPTIVELPDNYEVTVDEGKDAVLKCRATGNPKPSYAWFKPNGELPEGFKITDEGDLKLIRVITLDAGKYRCRASNNVDSVISDEITLKVTGTDPESGSINGGDSFDITIVAAVVGAAIIVIIVVAILVHMFIKRSRNQKGSPSYSTVPDNERMSSRYQHGPHSALPQQRLPGSSLPTHLHHQEMCGQPNCQAQSSTIAVPVRQMSGSPGVPGNFSGDYNEQPPPPYHPHLLATPLIPEQTEPEHQYDEINILMGQHHPDMGQHHPDMGQHHPDMLRNVNGYNSTFRLDEGLTGPGLYSSPRYHNPEGHQTPPQIPQRTHPNQGSYEVMRRDSPHRLNVSPQHHAPPPHHASPQSHVSTSPWGHNSDI